MDHRCEWAKRFVCNALATELTSANDISDLWRKNARENEQLLEKFLDSTSQEPAVLFYVDSPGAAEGSGEVAVR